MLGNSGEGGGPGRGELGPPLTFGCDPRDFRRPDAQAQVGDYVLVHAGFAIEVVDEQFALETIELVKQFPELADLNEAPTPA